MTTSANRRATNAFLNAILVAPSEISVPAGSRPTLEVWSVLVGGAQIVVPLHEFPVGRRHVREALARIPEIDLTEADDIIINRIVLRIILDFLGATKDLRNDAVPPRMPMGDGVVTAPPDPAESAVLDALRSEAAP